MNRIVIELITQHEPGSVPHSLGLSFAERLHNTVRPVHMKTIVNRYVFDVSLSNMTVRRLVVLTENIHELRNMIRISLTFFLLLGIDARNRMEIAPIET
eukprot:IDg12663t1